MVNLSQHIEDDSDEDYSVISSSSNSESVESIQQSQDVVVGLQQRKKSSRIS